MENFLKKIQPGIMDAMGQFKKVDKIVSVDDWKPVKTKKWNNSKFFYLIKLMILFIFSILLIIKRINFFRSNWILKKKKSLLKSNIHQFENIFPYPTFLNGSLSSK